jgi:small subunit ribosomal protein S25e
MAKGKADGKKDDKGGKKVSLLSKPKNAGGDSKGKKKKWSKSKVKDKLDSAVYFEQETLDKLLNEIPTKSKVITPAVVADKLKIGVSLARKALSDLHARGTIALVGEAHSSLKIYTRAVLA